MYWWLLLRQNSFFGSLFYYIFIFCFTVLYWFCHTLTLIHHGCTCLPNPEPPSHHPPHIISLGHPSAPAPSILYPVLNLDWRFVSYMIVYMFQCHSPKSSHRLPLPQNQKVSSMHLCLFCYFAYRVITRLSSVQSLGHVRLCDPMNRSTPGLLVHHQLPEFTQTHVH